MKARQVAAAAIFIALTFVVTRYTVIPIPATKGYFNLGEVVIFIAAIVFGPVVGALAGGLGAGLAAVSGSLLSMLFELTPFVGLPYTITALVVIILGGLGSVGGSLLGGLLLGVVESLGVYFTAPDLRMVISYGVLALVLVLRPYGLFNPMARRPGQSGQA